MTDGHVRDDIGGYVLGALDPAEHDAVVAHLAACPTCRAEYERLAGLPALLRPAEGIEIPDAPAAVEERILDRIAQERGLPVEPEAGLELAGRQELALDAGPQAQPEFLPEVRRVEFVPGEEQAGTPAEVTGVAEVCGEVADRADGCHAAAVDGRGRVEAQPLLELQHGRVDFPLEERRARRRAAASRKVAVDENDVPAFAREALGGEGTGDAGTDDDDVGPQVVDGRKRRGREGKRVPFPDGMSGPQVEFHHLAVRQPVHAVLPPQALPTGSTFGAAVGSMAALAAICTLDRAPASGGGPYAPCCAPACGWRW